MFNARRNLKVANFPVKRTSNKKARKHIHKKIAKQNQHIKYIKSILKSQTLSFYYVARECNEISQGLGAISLKRDQVGGSEMPLHIYPLDNIVNDGVQPVAAYKLNSNGYDFDSLGINVEGGGVTGQTHTTMGAINAMGKNILHKNYSDIKILLWGQPTRKTVFRIMLCRFLDEDLDMTLEPTTSNAERQEKRQILFTHQLLKKIISNPVVSSVVQKNANKRYKILWSKNYTIRERLSTEDENKHRLVKIFRKENKSLNYQDSPEIAVNLDADAVVHQDPSEPPTTYPSTSRQKTFLIITANCNAEDSTATYDIQMKSKYTMIGNT